MELDLSLIALVGVAAIALVIGIRIIALAAHALGLNPPAWLLESGFGPLSRIDALVILLVAFFILASIFLDVPYFDLVVEPKEATHE